MIAKKINSTDKIKLVFIKIIIIIIFHNTTLPRIINFTASDVSTAIVNHTHKTKHAHKNIL